MAFSNFSCNELKEKIDDVRNFLSISLDIANAHTVDFYTRDVWRTFMAVDPEEVLSAVSSTHDHTVAAEMNENISFGFCDVTKKLVDVAAFLRAAKALSLPGLGVCVQRAAVLESLRVLSGDTQGGTSDATLVPDEFMNSKKAHEVPAMSEVVAGLARCSRVKQVIDVGSGKGYLCSFLSMQYGLQVFGIDCSISNTHGAHERNRKLKKFSRVYRKHDRLRISQEVLVKDSSSRHAEKEEEIGTSERHRATPGQKERDVDERKAGINLSSGLCGMGEIQSPVSPNLARDHSTVLNGPGDWASEAQSENPFFGALDPDIVEHVCPRLPPSLLSPEERERRKRENLERKARDGRRNSDNDSLFSPLTSYVTAQTELRTLIVELEEAVMVGLHTCGDLASSTLRMFGSEQELRAVCNVGCCYHLLSERFDPDGQECDVGVCGFPMSQYLREQACFCGRNARMSACLALERVAAGRGISCLGKLAEAQDTERCVLLICISE
ncbi:putative methyltransferase-like protein 25 isoform X2 [Brachyhypopomus gauderio]|uniref:putative methyltransferase-like protein 25 isoform X2 n=1 Tax=Brachyhypopomus gauderio TaxID=698409 RepID=UPI00404290F4